MLSSDRARSAASHSRAAASVGVAPPRNAPPTISHAFRLVVTSHTPGWSEAVSGEIGDFGGASERGQGSTARAQAALAQAARLGVRVSGMGARAVGGQLCRFPRDA